MLIHPVTDLKLIVLDRCGYTLNAKHVEEINLVVSEEHFPFLFLVQYQRHSAKAS